MRINQSCYIGYIIDGRSSTPVSSPENCGPSSFCANSQGCRSTPGRPRQSIRTNIRARLAFLAPPCPRTTGRLVPSDRLLGICHRRSLRPSQSRSRHTAEIECKRTGRGNRAGPVITVTSKTVAIGWRRGRWRRWGLWPRSGASCFRRTPRWRRSGTADATPGRAAGDRFGVGRAVASGAGFA